MGAGERKKLLFHGKKKFFPLPEPLSFFKKNGVF